MVAAHAVLVTLAAAPNSDAKGTISAAIFGCSAIATRRSRAARSRVPQSLSAASQAPRTPPPPPPPQRSGPAPWPPPPSAPIRRKGRRLAHLLAARPVEPGAQGAGASGWGGSRGVSHAWEQLGCATQKTSGMRDLGCL